MNDMPIPEMPESIDDGLPGRDLVIAGKFLVPTEAHLARGCLVACGIPAVVADDQHAQAYSFIIPAMGGVRVLVPQAYLDEAKAVLEARERGDFTLDDQADVGDPD